MTQDTMFRRIDTKRADGCYVMFTRIEVTDDVADPRDYLFQDKDYHNEDARRLAAWQDGEWHFIGIRARANVLIVRNGMGTNHIVTSAGLWGIESDSGEDYLSEVYETEKAELLSDLSAMHNPIVEG